MMVPNESATPTELSRGPVSLQSFAEQVVNSTREYIYIRPEDGLMIIRPSRLHHLNPMATQMLQSLYNRPGGPDVEGLVSEISELHGADRERVRTDLTTLLQALVSVLDDRIMDVPGVKVTAFGSHKRTLPVLSEIALTYRCNNRCTFCYANAPNRGDAVPEMSTEEVQAIIGRIADEAHCPTLSFTGGEPTLREDLVELVRYGAQKGLRVNLITNGVRCGNAAYVQALADAGLDSAQVSIEGGSALIHDAITQHPGSWALATQGVRNLREAGIHTHTNTTINTRNLEALPALIDLLADMGQPYLSMNMVIRTGTALDHAEDDMSYAEVGPIITEIQDYATGREIEFIWYSPIPYCLFNPVQAGLGSKSCACVDGLISVNPSGELLPCSSFEKGIGDLLHRPFEEVWNSRAAHYWRNKEFIPPVCERCEIRHICCGACPLYWAQRGGFQELAGIAPGGSLKADVAWRAKKALFSGTFGVGLGPKRGRG